VSVFFGFFLVSGFCSLVYEIVWMRLSMAAFGANTAAISIFLSCFMAGIGLGCYVAGKTAVSARSGAAALRRYALTELWIGLGGLLVPTLLSVGHSYLNRLADAAPWQSWPYHAAAALCLTLAIVPWAAAMGATLPLGMSAIRRMLPAQAEKSFSYLYMANALGAAAGTLGSAFILIELFGFSATGRLAALLNGLVALSAYRQSLGLGSAQVKASPTREPSSSAASPKGVLAMLFVSGLACLGMEILWTRQYTAFLGNSVYAFALILWTYLSATFLGCELYRAWTKAERAPRAALLLWAAAAAVPFVVPLLVVEKSLWYWYFPTNPHPWGLTAVLRPAEYVLFAVNISYAAATLWALGRCWRWLKTSAAAVPGPAWTVVGALAIWPAMLADPRLPIDSQFTTGALRLVLGIGPFCLATGFMTAWLMDLAGHGSVASAAKAYALNTVGCLLGPLVAGFGIIPYLPERWGLAILSLPFFAWGGYSAWEQRKAAPLRWAPVSAALLAAALAIAAHSRAFEDMWPGALVRRDSTATVVAWGEDPELAINGVRNVTKLVTETKLMAHVPLAFLPHAPEKMLVICFGMGTTLRSARTWGIPVTVVELVPSVPKLFGFFHRDAAEVLSSPDVHVVIDDGRRYLERSRGDYDVITLDPSPPMQATGTSLLFSKEFYAAAKKNLRPGGILQTWTMWEDMATLNAMSMALKQSFPYVRVFGIGNMRGFHFLASDEPLDGRTAQSLAARLPPAAQRDLLEWEPGGSVRADFDKFLAREMALDKLALTGGPVLVDDRPYNEYFLVRKLFLRLKGALEGKTASPAATAVSK
jgi:predicted membrane-bound spermidine synthase